MRAHAGLLAAGVLTFVVMGIGQSLYGPALPVFQRLYAISEGQAGFLVSAHWVGCFAGVAAMFAFGDRITPRTTLVLMALGAAAVATLAGFAVTLGGAVVFGLGYGMSTAVFNPRVLVAFGDRGPSMLSLLNAMFGIGAIVAPLVFVWLASDPQVTFGLTAGLCALIAVFAGVAGTAPTAERAAAGSFRPHWPILCFGAASVGMEACLIGLGPTALIAAGESETRAAGLLSAFFVAFLAARVVLIFTAHRLPSFALYLGAVATTAVLALVATQGTTGTAFVAMGAAAGLFFPAFYVTASRKMGLDLRVPPTIIMAGLVGGISLPLIIAPRMGMLGDRGFFWIIAGIATVVTVLAIWLRPGMDQAKGLPDPDGRPG
jgi:MFS transporter, FHS family, glucose/mannose:H+ symporter